MNELKFCPKCGKSHLEYNNINKLSCQRCDFVLYHNCAAAVAVIIRYGDEVFLTKRNQEPMKGKLDLSGGFCDPNESAEETCKRELYEELNIEIDLHALKILATQPNVYHYKGIDYNTMDLFFEYRVEEKFSPQLEQSEISEGIWIPLQDLNLDTLAFESQKKFLAKYKAGK